jgi:hypothetical protein
MPVSNSGQVGKTDAIAWTSQLPYSSFSGIPAFPQAINQFHDARQVVDLGHELDALLQVEPDLPEVEADGRTPVGIVVRGRATMYMQRCHDVWAVI